MNNPGMTAGPMDWFNGLPRISRSYAACLVVTAACVSWGISFPFMLFLDWRSVFGGQVRTRWFSLLVAISPSAGPLRPSRRCVLFARVPWTGSRPHSAPDQHYSSRWHSVGRQGCRGANNQLFCYMPFFVRHMPRCTYHACALCGEAAI